MKLRRLGSLVLPPALVMVPLWFGARTLIAMNADPPVRESIELKTALEGARRARAKEFAQNEFRTAEAYSAQALSFHYRTVGEKTGFLNYDLVRARLRDARQKVDAAWKHARKEAGAARAEAKRLIGDGTKAFADAEDAVRSLPIGAVARANLARAQVAIGSASVRFSNGDYAGAGRDATLAKTTSEEIHRRATGFLVHYTNGAAAQRWSRWIEATIETSRRTGDTIILVDKLKHKCHLFRAGVLIRTYDVDLGGPLWDKMRAGDRATPEGMYRVVRKRAPGQTTYYKALLLNYPNDEDRAQFALAKRNGWISRGAGIGGLIEIHGEGGRKEDWTLGCVALSNRDMDELFRLVNIGTPVTIVGTITRGAAVSG